LKEELLKADLINAYLLGTFFNSEANFQTLPINQIPFIKVFFFG
jgi:hypothetical protein